MEKFTSKKMVELYYRKMLRSNKDWAIRGLIVIYGYQTESEKLNGEVNVNNGVGFTGGDSKILSSMAEWYNKYGYLSEKQIELVKKKMEKYAGQLMRKSIADGKLVKEGGEWKILTKKEK